MALTVEDGTGKEDADAYDSLANVSSYHTARGNSAWASVASDDVREQAIRRATDHIDQAFRFKGGKLNADQALAWPRIDVYDRDGNLIADDSVPTAVKRAMAELALNALAGDLMPNVAQGGAITQQTTTIGPISKSTSYSPGAEQGTEYKKVRGLLREYLASESSIDLVRA